MNLLVTTVDDLTGTVRIAQLLEKTKIPLTLFFLDDQPNLRHKLARLGLLLVPRYNLLDDILGIKQTTGIPITLQDLPHLETVPHMIFNTYYYSQAEKLLREVHLSEFKYVEQVIEYHGTSKIVSFYDDRGFIYKKEQRGENDALFQAEWLNERGDTVISFNQTDKFVVTSTNGARFASKRYDTFQEIEQEFLIKKIAQQPKCNIISDFLHLTKILSARNNQKTFGEQRLIAYYNGRETFIPMYEKYLRSTDRIVSATTWNLNVLLKNSLVDSRVDSDELKLQTTVVPTLPTELSLGGSRESATSNIYWYLNPNKDFNYELIFALLNYIQKNKRVELIVDGEQEERQRLALIVHKLISQKYHIVDDDADLLELEDLVEKHGMKSILNPPEWQKEKFKKMEQLHEKVAAIGLLFKVRFVDGHTRSANRLLSNSRVILDLNEPNYEHEVAAVSFGIPEITQGETEYLQDRINGYVLTNIGELVTALDYFLKDLPRWNDSLVANSILIEKYQKDNLIKRWSEVLADGNR